MHVESGATGARYRRWWLLCALLFAVTAGIQVYLAVTATVWWAWAAAAFFLVIALACGYAMLADVTRHQKDP
ncbi:hypothetical protein [Amycolatopsis alkalitolerans]|uniref:Uncharacterized protein n=1 Tax=Amycolatopsis alkalitolerans TaxID=2547244 RepID=A0A5C4M731_9PSEU|nr:hypothetical protein [Amycolatopsis alkalitolerans]TNC29074.1 hypothetical protein FG385_02915 [Amycolatopsis alkalitolerans]